MEKYTATYGKIKNSFVFQNISKTNASKSNTIDEYYGLFCIMKNIIQRGNPTKPSAYLTSQLGELDVSEYEPLKLISPDSPNWLKEIKGNDEDDDYPAAVFFNELMPKYLEEYAFVQQLTIPEAFISDIVLDITNEFLNQQVDFYIPQVKLVIEIDGTQHIEKLQKIKDNQRDVFLKRNGITTIRFTTKSIRTKDCDFTEKMQSIKDILHKSSEIQDYMDILNDSSESLKINQRLEYDTVIRFQLLLLSLLQNNLIRTKNTNWNFSLVNSNENIRKLFKIACKDLLIWLGHLCKLKKLPPIKPTIRLHNFKGLKDKTCLIIDFDMHKRWTDENEFNKNTIFVRNDYYDNHDYFRVSTTDSIEYKIFFEGKDSDIPHLKFMLKNLFGYDDFVDGQLPIIINALNRIDTIGILPTGSGKSLCYQFACLLQPCINFVVCPILSLMFDQKANLDELGITRTNHITSNNSGADKSRILKEFSEGKYLLIWISPERFQSQKFRDTLSQININSNFALAVIDEVHCLSEWGHDFRTSYLTLVKTIRHCCPEARMLGLTATASQFVLEDLKNEFDIDSNHIKSVTSMNRDELNFHLVKVDTESKYDTLVSVINQVNTKYGGEVFALKGNDTICGLVFTVFKNGKQGCINISQELSNTYKIKTNAYHGELGSSKITVQNDFKKNKTSLLVATKAFGMGINKKNIRYTVHYGLPWSIEAFYQEAGRAGRDKDKDKQQSDCYIVYEPETCSEQIMKSIFALKTDMSELETLSSTLRKDLGNIMFLWRQNNRGLDRDLKVMRKLMNVLHQSESDIIRCDDEYKKYEVEKGIYKLSLLGMIDDWTVEEWSQEAAVFKVSRNQFDEKTVHDALFRYIKRFDPAFSETDTTGRYTEYLNILKDDSLKIYTRYMKVLIQWSYDNIVYNRRQTIQNMMYLCDTYTDSDSFKRYIDNYFRFSETTILLDNIAYKPDDYDTWFEVFYTHKKVDEYRTETVPITKEGSIALLASLQRYLESYRYNTGLNFVSGMVELLCGKITNSEGLDRLDDAFRAIENYEVSYIENIIQSSLLVLKDASMTSRILFASFLLKRYPHKAKQIYKVLQDNSSLKTAITQSLHKIQKFEEMIEWQI